MSESEDELSEIRQQRRDELRRQLSGEDAGEEAGQEIPTEPVHVEGQSHFQQLVEDYDVVLVDFHADWCGPCKMLEPTVAVIARETDAVVAKVDVDALQGLAASHQVRGVPTLKLYANGQEVDRMVGVQPQEQLMAAVNQHL